MVVKNLIDNTTCEPAASSRLSDCYSVGNKANPDHYGVKIPFLPLTLGGVFDIVLRLMRAWGIVQW